MPPASTRRDRGGEVKEEEDDEPVTDEECKDGDGELSRKLLLIDLNEGGSELYVNRDGVSMLMSQSATDPLKLIMICGQARQGKSFLMNKLAGSSGLFRVSPKKEPCTFGVDISSSILSASDFDGGQRSLKGRVGFIDAEGQGDMGVSYDVQLVAPMLLMSKVVIYNWKGMPAKDDVLQKLNVMAEAARKISLDDSDSSKVFGHLHIILRDRSNIDGVRELLLEPETGRTTDRALQERNAIRNILNESFESISIWGFPSPVLDAHVLNAGTFTEHDTVGAFDDKVRELKTTIASQLREPKLFAGRPLTGPTVAGLLPSLASEMHIKQAEILPRSLFEQMETRRADEVRDACRMKLDAVIEELSAAVPIPAQRLADRMTQFREQAMSEVRTSLADLSKAQIERVEGELEGFIKQATEALMLTNCRGAAVLATKMQQEALAHVAKAFESRYKGNTVPVEESKLLSDFAACERQALQLFDDKLNGMLEMTEVASTRAEFVTKLELIRNAYVSHNKALKEGVEAEKAKAELVKQAEQTKKAQEDAEAARKAAKQAEERLEAARREVASCSMPQCMPMCGGGGGYGGMSDMMMGGGGGGMGMGMPAHSGRSGRASMGSRGPSVMWNNGSRNANGSFASRAAVEGAGYQWKSVPRRR